MESVEDRYYRGYIKIDLDCIEQNMAELKSHLSPDTKVAAVLKTDAYGHGAVPIAKVLQDQVYGFAVATIDEGINLRKHGLNNPIVILGFTHESRMEDVVRYQIRPAVFEYPIAEKISEAAVKLGKTAKIHIKVDTGMGRIGFLVNEESVENVVKISKLPNIEIEGIFTHFASSDSWNKDNTKKQFERFTWFIERIGEQGVKPAIKHCDNSAGIIDMPEKGLDMARAGIALYGMYPSDEVNKKSVTLRPALSMKSHIVYLKDVDSGCGISYGSTFVTTRKSKIATIPLGYGDGYQRALSNKGYVLVKGKKVPIVGRVCMDQFMVDVTDIEDVSEGVEVTLIGNDGDETITVEELAELAGSFNYEFVCDLGKRIPRVFYRKGKVVCCKDYFEDLYNYMD